MRAPPIAKCISASFLNFNQTRQTTQFPNPTGITSNEQQSSQRSFPDKNVRYCNLKNRHMSWVVLVLNAGKLVLAGSVWTVCQAVRLVDI